MKKLVLAIVACLLVSSPSMATTEVDLSEKLKQRVSAANQKIMTIESSELKKWINEEDKEFILLDVREANEIAAGKIEADNYMSIPRGLVEMQFIRKVKETDKTVVVYCLKGSRGALAAEALTDLGYTDIYNLKGGVLEWIDAGYTVSNFLGEFELQNFESNF